MPTQGLRIQFFALVIVLEMSPACGFKKAKSPTLGRRALQDGYDGFVTSMT
jgi:hypothetical protein